MSYIFQHSTFNKNINNWNVGKVKNMAGMFNMNQVFNQPLNKWNTENVENMNSMFRGASKFNQPLDKWKVSKVLDMSYMFNLATDFDQSINELKLNPRLKHIGIFNGATTFIHNKSNYMFVFSDDFHMLDDDVRSQLINSYLLQHHMQRTNETPQNIFEAVGAVYKPPGIGGKARTRKKYKSRRRQQHNKSVVKL